MGGKDVASQAQKLRVLVNEADIARRVAELALDIARDYPASEPLVVVSVMKGSLVFLADLIRRLPMPIEVELVEAKSYQGTERAERVRVLDDVAALPVAGRHVLLLDCVLDTGHTLVALRRELAALAPASLRICVLLRKERPGSLDLEPDYVGLSIPDAFVVGYGLDHANRWRHLPYIAELIEGDTP
jgi:hypoxanthine phosphoribosyltransferase